MSKSFFTRMERRTHAKFGIEIRLVKGEAGIFKTDEAVFSFASGLERPSGPGIHNDVFRLWHKPSAPTDVCYRGTSEVTQADGDFRV